MVGQFELSKNSDDQYRFVPKAGNGEIILISELYTMRGAVEKGIVPVHVNSPLDERHEKKTASNGKLHFNLKTANHQIIDGSQPHADGQSREIGIVSVRTNDVSQTIKGKT